jgi:CDP-diglyceride synthetase
MVLEFYVSLLPVILAGIATMVWIKAPILAFLESPLDLGKELKDGERLFGDHKTFKGLVGYVGFAAISTAAWGLICSTSDRLTGLNLLYVRFDNTLGYNLAIGALLGLTWALFELPNSFMKRRLKIEPGKPAVGVQKVLFTLVDQSDSIFGCVLVLFMTCPLTIAEYFIFVAIGTATHLVINVLLWLARLRKEPF